MPSPSLCRIPITAPHSKAQGQFVSKMTLHLRLATCTLRISRLLLCEPGQDWYEIHANKELQTFRCVPCRRLTSVPPYPPCVLRGGPNWFEPQDTYQGARGSFLGPAVIPLYSPGAPVCQPRVVSTWPSSYSLQLSLWQKVHGPRTVHWRRVVYLLICGLCLTAVTGGSTYGEMSFSL